MRYTPVTAVMYNVVPSPAQLQFAGFSGGLIVPILRPARGKTQSPPGPLAYTLPFESTFRPSGRPSSFCDVASKNTRPLDTLPSAATSYFIQTFRFSSELETYNAFSSGEKAMPFGRVRSLMI